MGLNFDLQYYRIPVIHRVISVYIEISLNTPCLFSYSFSTSGSQKSALYGVQRFMLCLLST